MSRLARNLAVVGVVGAMALATSSAAVAQTDKPPTKGTDCLVQYLDERGGIIRAETEPEGASTVSSAASPGSGRSPGTRSGRTT